MSVVSVLFVCGGELAATINTVAVLTFSSTHKKKVQPYSSCSSTPAPFALQKKLNVVRSNFILSKIKGIKIRKYVIISHQL